MADDTLNNILNLLQSNNGNNNTQSNNNNSNNEMQMMLLKFLLSGGLNNLFPNQNATTKPESTPPTPTPPRTINLENYQRLDWTTIALLTTSTAT